MARANAEHDRRSDLLAYSLSESRRPSDPSLLQVFTVLVIAAIHAGYFFFFVEKAAVLEASDQCGRQLILSCEALMSESK
ncbi:hypothetical protein [Mesorhizobium sp. WSM2561]|uniref:hypothetical protein n=1 Tax=Mesorhizobium sp. WSM2561 TaxID=1040985 RepID=UPI0012EBA573|nr:hypothetical protein [Mesorhizobium sp. WSM2561]